MSTTRTDALLRIMWTSDSLDFGFFLFVIDVDDLVISDSSRGLEAEARLVYFHLKLKLTHCYF